MIIDISKYYHPKDFGVHILFHSCFGVLDKNFNIVKNCYRYKASIGSIHVEGMRADWIRSKAPIELVYTFLSN